jgi:hypothetical protein
MPLSGTRCEYLCVAERCCREMHDFQRCCKMFVLFRLFSLENAVHMYVHTYIYIYIHTHIYIHTYIHTHTHLYIHTLLTHTDTHTRLHARRWLFANHQYIRTLTHTYTHTFTQVLSDEEMAIVSSVMIKSLNDATININIIGTCACGGLVMCRKPTFARWHAENWDPATKTWRDSSGNNRHSISSEGTIQRTTSASDGAVMPQTYLYGGTTSKIVFPAGSLPPTFTLCIMARYNGGTRGRIFVSPTGNMFHGHWNTYRGTTIWMDTWMANAGLIKGPNTDWLVFCGKNPGTKPNNILMNTIPSGVATSSFTTTAQLQLNNPAYESSDWAAAHAIVFDQALSDEELAHVSGSIYNSLFYPISIPTLGSNSSTCRCYVAFSSCDGTSTPSQAPCGTCAKCLPGTFTSLTCSIGCSLCPYGTYSTLPQETSCIQCAAGSFSMNTGASTCLACPAAKFGAFVGMTSCYDVSVIASVMCTTTCIHTRLPSPCV